MALERLKRTLFALYDQIIDPADAYSIIKDIFDVRENNMANRQKLSDNTGKKLSQKNNL